MKDMNVSEFPTADDEINARIGEEEFERGAIDARLHPMATWVCGGVSGHADVCPDPMTCERVTR